MTKLTMSVIIPMYNSGKLILDALESVASQNRPADEIIVVDDGSTDDSAELASAWGKSNFENFKMVSKQNGGSASARNAGIRAATGDVIALLDADDLLSPRHLQTFEAMFNRAPESILCFADAIRERFGEDDKKGFLENSALLDLKSESLGGGFSKVVGSAYLGLIGGSRIATCSCVFRRDSAIQCGLYSEVLRTAEDREFLLRLSRHGEFAYSTEKLAIVRIHGANKTSGNRKERGKHRRARVKMLLELLTNVEKMGLNTEEREATFAEINSAVAKSSYWTAREGLAAYLRWRAELKRKAPEYAKRDWLNCVRAVCWSLIPWSKRIQGEKS